MSEILWDGKEVIGVIDGHGSYDWICNWCFNRYQNY